MKNKAFINNILLVLIGFSLLAVSISLETALKGNGETFLSQLHESVFKLKKESCGA